MIDLTEFGKNDKQSLMIGVYQSLLLGGLMRFYGTLSGLGGFSPFVVGMAFAGFSLGVRSGEKARPGRTDIRFIISSAVLGFLVISRLCFFSIFRTLFMGENPAPKLALLAVSIWLSCYLFSYMGYRYSLVLRRAEKSVLNYAFLAAGFALGTAGYGVLSAFSGPDISMMAALVSGMALVEGGKVKYAGAAVTLAVMLCAIPVRERHFDSIMFAWGISDYRRAASEWSPYYKIDLLTYNNGDSMCGLYNYTCMMLGFRETGPGQESRRKAARYFFELHDASIPRNAKSILIVGSGMGTFHPAAARPSVEKITAIEIDSVIVNLMKEEFSEYNNGFYNDPRVKTVVAEGRRYLEGSDEKFDFIEYESLDTRMYSTAMSVIPVENALYTREGLSRAVDHLSEGGLFRITIGTDDDDNVVRPLLSGLPEDMYLGVYRVWIDMTGFSGVGKGGRNLKGSLDGFTGRMPQTVIFASRNRAVVGRIGEWYDLQGEEAADKILRLDIEPDPELAPTDDHPFLGGRNGPGRQKGVFFTILLIMLIVPAGIAARGNANGRMHYFFYLIGAGYIGLEILLLARGAHSSRNPALATLVVAAVFVAGNALACLAAHARTPGRGALAVAAVFLAVLIHFSCAITVSLAFAVAAGAAAGFLGGLFWPAALAGLDPGRRGHALFSDTLGVFPGIVLFHGLLFTDGFQSAGMFVSALYILATVLFVFRPVSVPVQLS